MGRPAMTEQRRIEICRALERCMIQHGSYETTSVKDIAQEVNLTAGLIHHYFTSKDEILLTTAEIVLLSVQNTIEDLLHTRDAAQRTKRLQELLADENQSRFLLQLYALSLSMPAVRELIDRKHTELQESLCARLRRRRSFQGDPEAKGQEVLFLLESAMMQTAATGRPYSGVLLEKALEEIFPTVGE